MKVSFPTMIAALFAACAFGTVSANAQDYYASAYDTGTVASAVSQDEVDDADPVEDGNGGIASSFMMPTLTASAGWQFEFEALFLRWHKAGGSQVGNDIGTAADPDARGTETVETPFDFSPRISISRVRSSNIFSRIRWFDYQHSALVAKEGPNADGVFGGASIDAFSIDFVGGERFYVGRGWDIEVEGGVRWMGYEESLLDVNSATVADNEAGSEFKRNVSWAGGAIVGLEARKQLTGNMSMFGRARFAVVQGGHRILQGAGGDALATTAYLNNHTSFQVELSTGSEWSWILDSGDEVFFRWTGEAIHWSDVSSEWVAGGGDIDNTFGGTADVGWGGFGLVFGIYR